MSMVELRADFGSVIEGLGVADAYLSTGRNKPYWDAVIGIAFDHANNEFNISAAAYGAAGGIKHMFEWGTTGINRQATNMRPAPLEERARLWKANFHNNGPSAPSTVDFEFKPSIANVPVSTAVPQQIRALMRKHQFTWKAEVMETNRPVHISRQEAQFLLIPYDGNMSGFKSYDIKRGYKLTKRDIISYPGRQTAGNFTAFWTRYWASAGPEAMEASLRKEIAIDFEPLFKVTRAKSAVMPRSIIADVKARSTELQRAVAMSAKARRMRK
jgi:hypothetical protein